MSITYINEFISLEPVCQPQFDRLSINVSCSSISSLSIPLVVAIVADVNADNQVDLIFFCQHDRTVNVMLGNSSDIFGPAIKFSYGTYLLIQNIRTGDMNDDGRVDLIISYNSPLDPYVSILYGNNTGTFDSQKMQQINITQQPSEIIIADLNNDKKLEIVILTSQDIWSSQNNTIYVYFGNTNGTFLLQMILPIWHDSDPQRFVVGDFNNDHYLDFAVINRNNLYLHVFFANGNGSFQLHNWFFTAIVIDDCYNMVTGDFDGNNQTDILFLYSWKDTVSKLYRYNNSAFLINDQVIMDSFLLMTSVAVGDLNNDHHLDVIMSTKQPCEIYGLLGDGAGSFQTQTIYSPQTTDNAIWISVNDLNNDSCLDIISIEEMSTAIDLFLNTCECSRH